MAELANALRSGGREVRTLVVHAGAGPHSDRLHLQLDWWSRQRRPHLGKPKGLGELRMMWAFGRGGRLSADLARRLTGRYDMLLVEHPWCFDLAWQLRRHEACADAAIVYSAHNIESEMRETMWKSAGQWNRAAQRLVAQVREHEFDCARRADLCLATSENDAAVLRASGARQLLVLPNGVHPLAARDPNAAHPAQPYLMFVASSHGPNVTGFSRWFAAPLDMLPAGSAIVLAGTVGRMLRRDRQYADEFARGRLIDAGFMDRAQLDQYLLHSNGVVLPISAGGGTNLKTAEALMSLRPVLATSFAMRGFEAWGERPRVQVLDDAAEFRQAAARLLTSPWHADEQDPTVESLSWQSCLRPLGAAVAHLLGSNSAARVGL